MSFYASHLSRSDKIIPVATPGAVSSTLEFPCNTNRQNSSDKRKLINFASPQKASQA